MASNTDITITGGKVVENANSNGNPQPNQDNHLKVTKDFLVQKESDYLQHNRKLNRR